MIDATKPGKSALLIMVLSALTPASDRQLARPLANGTPPLPDTAGGDFAAQGGAVESVLCARMLLEEGRSARALEVLEKAKAAGASDPQLVELLVEAKAFTGDTEGARQLLSGVAAGTPGDDLSSPAGVN